MASSSTNEVHGDGAPLLLIGGLGADVNLHRAIIAGLAASHQVIAFDNRGAGRSSKPDAAYSIPMMAADAVALLDALGIACTDLLGISTGGRIALAIAANDPDRVCKVVLVSTSAAGTGQLRMSTPMRLMSLLMSVPGLREKDTQPRYAHVRQGQAATSYHGTAQLPHIHAPTLIMHGRRDRSIPLARAQRLRAGIAGSQLVVFNGGHMFCFFTERDRFLTQVNAFLAG